MVAISRTGTLRQNKQPQTWLGVGECDKQYYVTLCVCVAVTARRAAVRCGNLPSPSLTAQNSGETPPPTSP